MVTPVRTSAGASRRSASPAAFALAGPAGARANGAFPDEFSILASDHGSYLVASHDGGKTFDPTRLHETPANLSGVEISKSDPDIVYAAQVTTFGTSAKLPIDGRLSAFLRASDGTLCGTDTTALLALLTFTLRRARS